MMLDRGDKSSEFFDEDGNFTANVRIPETSFEDENVRLNKEDEQDTRTKFFDFIRRIFVWLPEERASAKELLEHPFLAEAKAMVAADEAEIDAAKASIWQGVFGRIFVR